MTLLGLLGVVLALLAWKIAFVERTRSRAAIFMLALIFHIAASVIYCFWSLTTSADASMYYSDSYGFYGDGFGLSTRFVIYFVQYLREFVGGTYLDYFLLFQAFGFWGVVFMMRTFEEIHIELGTKQPAFTYLLLFLPGIHFWTSAIGKDAPLFLAASLAVWSAMQLRRRFIGFGVAILLMVLFRPYIALALLMALAVAASIDPRSSIAAKLGLMTLAVAALVPIMGTVENTFTVDVTSAEAVGDFLQRQSEVTAGLEGGSQLAGASLPVKVFSLLFRPMFIDAGGVFGLIASFENLLLLVIVVSILRNFRGALEISRRVFFVRFGLIFALALILLLSLMYYNVGLGLRQKVMFLPGLLTLFVATHAVRRTRGRPLIPSAV